MSKPKITLRPVTSKRDGPNERTIEFPGGLIGIYYTDSGITVSLYRLDDDVSVWLGGKIVHSPTAGGGDSG